MWDIFHIEFDPDTSIFSAVYGNEVVVGDLDEPGKVLDEWCRSIKAAIGSHQGLAFVAAIMSAAPSIVARGATPGAMQRLLCGVLVHVADCTDLIDRFHTPAAPPSAKDVFEIDRDRYRRKVLRLYTKPELVAQCSRAGLAVNQKSLKNYICEQYIDHLFATGQMCVGNADQCNAV